MNKNRQWAAMILSFFRFLYLHQALNKYAKTKVADGQGFDFLDYDWTLNEQTEAKEQLVKEE